MDGTLGYILGPLKNTSNFLTSIHSTIFTRFLRWWRLQRMLFTVKIFTLITNLHIPIWYLQVAAATDRRHLRIFSTGGMQREVLSLPGPIVAMSGFHDKLMVSVHIGMPLPGNQCIGNVF